MTAYTNSLSKGVFLPFDSNDSLSIFVDFSSIMTILASIPALIRLGPNPRNLAGLAESSLLSIFKGRSLSLNTLWQSANEVYIHDIPGAPFALSSAV